MAVVLNLEGIAGSTPLDVAKSMVDVASRVGVMVSLNFNGHYMLAKAGDDPNDIVSSYQRWLRLRPDAR